MSYCVHCGVELEKSETKCPLCGTIVLDPSEPAPNLKNVPRPYPKRVEQLNARINRQFTSVFVSVFMFFAALICLIINFLTENGLSWSQYVVSSVFLAWVVVTGPLLFRKGIILKSILCDTAALLLFLYMIQQTDGTAAWYYAVAAPITGLAAAFAVLIDLGVRAKILNGLALAASIVFAAAVGCIAIEVLTDLYLYSHVHLGWSLYVLIPCLCLVCFMLILRQKRRLNAEVKKRLHF